MEDIIYKQLNLKVNSYLDDFLEENIENTFSIKEEPYGKCKNKQKGILF